MVVGFGEKGHIGDVKEKRVTSDALEAFSGHMAHLTA